MLNNYNIIPNYFINKLETNIKIKTELIEKKINFNECSKWIYENIKLI